MIPKSQMKFGMRRSELPHERQKSNLAAPLASKSWRAVRVKNSQISSKTEFFNKIGSEPPSQAAQHLDRLVGLGQNERPIADIQRTFPMLRSQPALPTFAAPAQLKSRRTHSLRDKVAIGFSCFADAASLCAFSIPFVAPVITSPMQPLSLPSSSRYHNLRNGNLSTTIVCNGALSSLLLLSGGLGISDDCILEK